MEKRTSVKLPRAETAIKTLVELPQAETSTKLNDNKAKNSTQISEEHLQVIVEMVWIRDTAKQSREGSSKVAVAEDNGEPFRVYCKGLVSKERVRDRIVEVAGIGVVICDSKDHVVFEMKKPLRNEQIMYVEIVELEALTEAMDAALTLNIKRVVFIFDDSKFHHPWRRSKVREEPSNLIRILLFIQGVQNLRDKFPHYSVSSVAEGDIKHAYRLARDAVISQISWPYRNYPWHDLERNLCCLFGGC
ncbi:Uncharacterized protein Fot_42168 [Forsythia ovata]|uniref:RNase H type-1 domain-containing protein n=1 Tax=Forsythia ovata TaxID=205694 RepID=A0ABD1RL51_9LAMI